LTAEQLELKAAPDLRGLPLYPINIASL
jgi:hypothetical protein